MKTASSILFLLSLVLSSTATFASAGAASNAHPVRVYWEGAIADVQVQNRALKGGAQEGIAVGTINRLVLESVWDDTDIVHVVHAEVAFRFRVQGPDRVLITDLRFRGVDSHSGDIRQGRISGVLAGTIRTDSTGGVYIDDIIIGMTGRGRPPLGLLLPAVQ